MPVRGHIQLKGFEDYLEKLAKAGKDIDASAKKAVLAGAEVIRKGMYDRAPKGKTGYLKANIKIFERFSQGNYHSARAGVDLGKELADYGKPGSVTYKRKSKDGVKKFKKTWGREHLYMIYVEYGRHSKGRTGVGARPYANPTLKKDTKKANAAVKKSLEEDGKI